VHSGPFNRLISSSSLAAFGQKTVDFQYVPGTIIQMYALSHTPNIMVAARWSHRTKNIDIEQGHAGELCRRLK
jgi:hypothetical protein